MGSKGTATIEPKNIPKTNKLEHINDIVSAIYLSPLALLGASSIIEEVPVPAVKDKQNIFTKGNHSELYYLL